MTPAELNAARMRVEAGIATEPERVLLEHVETLRLLLAEATASLATTTHESGCWPSEGRHTKGCLARRATLATMRAELGLSKPEDT